MTVLFWTCAAVVLYVYLGYPLLLRLGWLGHRRPLPRGKPEQNTMRGASGEAAPLVSIIVAAHNEEFAIEAKIASLLAADYPRERVEILIGSDGSSDRTEDLVRRFANDGVGLISFPQQQGKSAMQNGLVAASCGSILVFTDADCISPPDALPLLLENLGDPGVGLVTARPRYQNANETAITENESIYLAYESWLREQESVRGILAIASGSLFAIRRELWAPLEAGLGDDLVLPLRVAAAGFQNVLDVRVSVVTRLTQSDPRSMLRLKTRIISKDFRGLCAHATLLNPFRHGALAIALWSHKMLRWLMPYFLITLFVANCFLLDRPTFRVTLAAQSAFYALALVGFLLQEFPKSRSLRGLWSVPLSFCIVNLAALLGTLKGVAGGSTGQWKPVRKHSPAA